MLNWSDPNSNPMQDLKDAKSRVNGLVQQASKEASDFISTLQTHNSENFTRLWAGSKWSEIRKYYPEFDLTTEAQKHLITASGGEQS